MSSLELPSWRIVGGPGHRHGWLGSSRTNFYRILSNCEANNRDIGRSLPPRRKLAQEFACAGIESALEAHSGAVSGAGSRVVHMSCLEFTR